MKYSPTGRNINGTTAIRHRKNWDCVHDRKCAKMMDCMQFSICVHLPQFGPSFVSSRPVPFLRCFTSIPRSDLSRTLLPLVRLWVGSHIQLNLPYKRWKCLPSFVYSIGNFLIIFAASAFVVYFFKTQRLNHHVLSNSLNPPIAHWPYSSQRSFPSQWMGSWHRDAERRRTVG